MENKYHYTEYLSTTSFVRVNCITPAYAPILNKSDVWNIMLSYVHRDFCPPLNPKFVSRFARIFYIWLSIPLYTEGLTWLGGK